MVRCFYTLFSVLFLLSCSGGNPARHLLANREWLNDVPLISEDFENIRSFFPLHYSVKVDSAKKHITELSYSFITSSGDSAFWEEGMVRMP
ncbi:MAG: hypothetical protein IJY44_01175 [Bacteroidaceae bacterium]|nr:hypothetical protein [Bacteroidaceae bacterium]